MKKCPVCNSTYHDDSNIYCEDCGCILEYASEPETTTDSTDSYLLVTDMDDYYTGPVQKKKTNNTGKIVIIIVAILLGIAALATGIFFIVRSAKKPDDNQDAYADMTELHSDSFVSPQPEHIETTTAAETTTEDPTVYYVLSSMTDENGVTSFKWIGNMCQQTNPSGSTIIYDFNSDGSTRNKRGDIDTTVYDYDFQCSYDTNGDLISRIYNSGRTEYFQYDDNGNLVYFERSDTYEYRTVTYIYSQDNKIEKSLLISKSDRYGETLYTTETYYFYDNFGNIIRQEWITHTTLNNITQSGTRTFDYTTVNKAVFNVYVNSEILTNINVRLNVYTNKVIINGSKY